MSELPYHPAYPLDSDQEPLRLERQARMYGSADDLRHLALSLSDRVLDVGCGSGGVTRVIACAVPKGRAKGVDRDPKYIDFTRRKAAVEGIDNIQFAVSAQAEGISDAAIRLRSSRRPSKFCKPHPRSEVLQGRPHIGNRVCREGIQGTPPELGTLVRLLIRECASPPGRDEKEINAFIVR